MNKKLVRSQFKDKAEAYATSAVHAKGGSLQLLVEMIDPQPSWEMLDVATAAGHTAHAFAPHVARVVASDITPEMLPKAASLAQEKGITNLTTEVADAEALPFADQRFDLVTCRIAPHHFPAVPRFAAEAFRVLKPGGRLGLVDNIVPGKRTNKKWEQAAFHNAAAYINAFEKLRDPSHARALSIIEWRRILKKAGFLILETTTLRKKMTFGPWADRMQVSPKNKLRLEIMLRQAPQLVEEFLTPEFSGDKIDFFLTELILVGQRPAAPDQSQ